MAREHIIDINKLVIATTREWNSGQLSGKHDNEEKTSKLQIHRLHIHIPGENKHAYLPNILSIGPYNHGVPATKDMQVTKYEFLNHILNLRREKGLSDYLEAMKALEKQVRSCYADKINMDRNDFLKMLLLDGCFILVSLMPELLKSYESSGASDMGNIKSVFNEEVTRGEPKSESIQHEDEGAKSDRVDLQYSQKFWHDLLILENQIPFFIIEKIHELIVGQSNRTSVLITNVIRSMESTLNCYTEAICKSIRPKKFYHLLHLCHMYLRPCCIEVESNESLAKPPLFHNIFQVGSNLLGNFMQRSFRENSAPRQQPCPWRRAVDYDRAGIHFKKKKFCSENPHSLLDIEFYNGIMEMSCLTIDLNTYSLLCNLMAFEQTCPQFGCYVTAYVIFLSNLINISDDVLLLIERGIITNHLNSDAEVARLFNAISEYVVFDFDCDYYLKPLSYRLEVHYQNRRPVLRQFFDSITSKLHRWTQNNESSGLPITTSEEIPM